jgi:hypothetical protein
MIPVPVLPALSMFSRKLTVYIIAGYYDVNKRWIEPAAQPDFTISGVFQAADDKDLQLLPEGDRSKGASILHTKRKLPITDTSQLKGQETKQVFVKDGGEVWRVLKLQDWDSNAGFYRYICVRHLETKGHLN